MIEKQNSNSGSDKVHNLQIKEDEDIQLRQQFGEINEINIQINQNQI